MLNWAKLFMRVLKGCRERERERDGAGGGAGETCHRRITLVSVTLGSFHCGQQLPGEMLPLSQDSEMTLQQVRFCFKIFIVSQILILLTFISLFKVKKKL